MDGAKSLFLRGSEVAFRGVEMSEVLNKAFDLVSAQPNVVIGVLVAVALVLIVATPVLSLALAGYVVRALVQRQAKGESR
jgi:hypothetical protein